MLRKQAASICSARVTNGKTFQFSSCQSFPICLFVVTTLLQGPILMMHFRRLMSSALAGNDYHINRYLAFPVFFLLLAMHTFAPATSGVINPLTFPGANLCIQIQAVIAANASANHARSATGTQQCTVNPFSGATVLGQLLLGVSPYRD
jgi:hypothetical protein